MHCILFHMTMLYTPVCRWTPLLASFKMTRPDLYQSTNLHQFTVWLDNRCRRPTCSTILTIRWGGNAALQTGSDSIVTWIEFYSVWLCYPHQFVDRHHGQFQDDRTKSSPVYCLMRQPLQTANLFRHLWPSAGEEMLHYRLVWIVLPHGLSSIPCDYATHISL